MAGVICAFNRDRDGYEVPLSFAEVERLDCFVTDYYAGRPFQNFRSLSGRRASGLHPRFVRVSPFAFFVQALWVVAKRFNRNVPFPSNIVDRAIGRRARKAAAVSPGSGLLLHAGYALEAFTASPEVSRVLYEFHPSPQLVRSALAEDHLGSQMPLTVREPEETNHERLERSDLERSLSTGFIVSSSFTARGLLAAGVPADRVRVVPYGVSLPSNTTLGRGLRTGSKFLFVGQGVRRKGLHILLEAWGKAGIAGGTLTLVCYRIDPEIRRIAESTAGVRLLGKQPKGELDSLFAEHDVFVLPSLVEGFGLVLLEALAHGCRLVATDHTGLPDLELPETLGAVVESADIDGLARALENMVSTPDGSEELRKQARAAAEVWSWARYRLAIRDAFDELASLGSQPWHVVGD